MSNERSSTYFDPGPQVIEAMQIALDMARQAPMLKNSADVRTLMIEDKIIELAEAGETDPELLCASALCRISH
jgi:hypothetical protein